MTSISLENLSNEIHIRYDKMQRIKNIREKNLQKQFFSHNGNLFCANPQLISFLNAFSDKEIVVEDVYQNPVLVDRENFLILAKQHYQEVMNSWLLEYEEVLSSRKQDL